MKTLVPPPLFGNAAGDEKPNITRPAPKAISLFDAAFLRRVYRSMLLFGIAFTVLQSFGRGYGFGTFAGTGSFIGGMLLAALLLRAQEMSVRSMLRPAKETGGIDAKLLIILLLPLKFIAVGALLWSANSAGVLKMAPFGLGFFVAQLILLCQVAGLLLRRALARK